MPVPFRLRLIRVSVSRGCPCHVDRTFSTAILVPARTFNRGKVASGLRRRYVAQSTVFAAEPRKRLAFYPLILLKKLNFWGQHTSSDALPEATTIIGLLLLGGQPTAVCFKTRDPVAAANASR